MQPQTNCLLDLDQVLMWELSWFLFLLSWLTFWHKQPRGARFILEHSSKAQSITLGKSRQGELETVGHRAFSGLQGSSSFIPTGSLVTSHTSPAPHSEGTLLFFTVLLRTSQTSLVGRSSCQKCDPFPISPWGLACGWLELLTDPGTNTLPPFFTIDLCQIL